MKLRTKLFLGFGALILLMMVVAAVEFNKMNSVNRNLNDIYNNRYNKVHLAFNTRIEVYNMQKAISTLLLNGNSPTEVGKAVIEIDAANIKAGQYFQSLTKNVDDGIQRQLINEILQSGDYFTIYKDKVKELVLNGKLAAAIEYRDKEGLMAQEALHKKLDNLLAYHEMAMDDSYKKSLDNNHSALLMTILLSVIGVLLGLGIMFWIIYSITGGLTDFKRMIQNFSNGTIDANSLSMVTKKDEIGLVAQAFYSVAVELEEKTNRERELNKINEEQAWLKMNIAQMATRLQGVNNLQKVAQEFIYEITPTIRASYGALFLLEGGQGEGNVLTLSGAYAYMDSSQLKSSFHLGEGLIGQCALDKKTIVLTDISPHYVKIHSALGETGPLNLMVHPVLFDNELVGVFELASLEEFSPLQQLLLDQVADHLGIIINSISGRLKVENLLRISQALTEELQSQSEELLSQQNELQMSNEQLEEQIKETQIINLQKEKTKEALEQQAIELAKIARYKSEFLANMSHELRTPLNSLLILSQMLADNKGGNLTAKQIEYASTIHSSGYDLLRLIDEVLDLSKVESGKIEIMPEMMRLNELEKLIMRGFAPVAKEKGIHFRIKIEEEVPQSIFIDSYRLQQILKNLLSNAFKFTSEGSVALHVHKSEKLQNFPGIRESKSTIAFSVTDTGIGIPLDKRELIFDAFQQVDGTTSRKYGGTGLGLSISRELARLLGGVIGVESKEGEGSIFTLYIPENYTPSLTGLPSYDAQWSGAMLNSALSDVATGEEQIPETPWERNVQITNTLKDQQMQPALKVEDDRENLDLNVKILLIIEDDPNFANILLEIARSRGFKGLVAMQGNTGLMMAKKYKPDAIILDIRLPVMDGWSILHHLKQNLDTRHIPVHVMSAIDNMRQGLSMGAIAYLKKPIDKECLEQAFTKIEDCLEHRLKKLLIVEENLELRDQMLETVGHDDVFIYAVSSGREALKVLSTDSFDCMVLDLDLSDISGFEILENIKGELNLHNLPIIIATNRELSKHEETKLNQYAETIIVKSVKSPERLLDETSLFLHRVKENLPEDKQGVLEKLHSTEFAFLGKKVLVVDDDIRNVFAISSVLEGYEMEIVFAENGREALEALERESQIDIVLMDMMMPEMDGYQAMRAIRNNPVFEKLPIIALTAQAMNEDRTKCMEAGASDYITKPFHSDQLLSVMKTWLYK